MHYHVVVVRQIAFNYLSGLRLVIQDTHLLTTLFSIPSVDLLDVVTGFPQATIAFPTAALGI